MTSMKMVRKISQRVNKIVLLVFSLLCCSCEGVLFHDFCSTSTDGWSKSDTLEYVYEKDFVKDSALLLYVDTRTIAGYPYKDILLSVEALDSIGTVFYKDTLICAVYDDAGRRIGKTAGVMYQQSIEPINVFFPYQKTVLHVMHLMPDSFLYGVSDVGIRLCRDN